MLQRFEIDQQKHTDQQPAYGLTPLDCAKVLDFIQNGVSFELKEGMIVNIPRATRRNFIPTGPVLDRKMVQETLDLWKSTDSVLQAPIIDKWEEKVNFWNQQQWTKFRDRDGNEPGLLFGDASKV
jgi:hypothetical protein|tara:strand:+ start:314 stop:688 length:375 start_codon:yes stop_codon:yes gene_type:complete